MAPCWGSVNTRSSMAPTLGGLPAHPDSSASQGSATRTVGRASTATATTSSEAASSGRGRRSPSPCLVDDDPWVFSSSLRENLRLARPEADDVVLHAALDVAGLTAWAAALPHGLDTLVGDGHRSVSGGERARLGLARALLSGAEVLVLDEPTAHLDHAMARQVAADVLAATGDRALVWITHAPEELEEMDRVLRLAEPRGHRLALPVASV